MLFDNVYLGFWTYGTMRTAVLYVENQRFENGTECSK